MERTFKFRHKQRQDSAKFEQQAPQVHEPTEHQHLEVCDPPVFICERDCYTWWRYSAREGSSPLSGSHRIVQCQRERIPTRLTEHAKSNHRDHCRAQGKTEADEHKCADREPRRYLSPAFINERSASKTHDDASKSLSTVVIKQLGRVFHYERKQLSEPPSPGWEKADDDHGGANSNWRRRQNSPKFFQFSTQASWFQD